MKMKSKLFGNSAKLALTLLAMCGMFASCYEKDEIDVPTPVTPTETTYKIAGIVTDEDGAGMSGVTVTNTVNSKTATTATDGAYSVEAKVGETNVVTFTKSGYKTATSSVFVTKQENGSIVAYTINAQMIKGKDTPKYKTVQYNVEGSVFDATSNAKIAIKTVTMAGIVAVPTIADNTFSFENVTVGQHTVYITADGYTPTTAEVVISEVAAPEGEGVHVHTAKIAVGMQKVDVVADAKYYLSGCLYNENGAVVNNATVTVKVGTYSGTSNSVSGAYKVEIPAENIKGLTKAFVAITHANYKTYYYTAFVAPIKAGEVSNKTIDVTLIKKSETIIPDEDENEVFIPGNADITFDETVMEKTQEVAPEKAAEEKVPSQASVETSINKALEDAGSTVKITTAQAEKVVEAMQQYVNKGTIESVEKIAILPIEKEMKVEVKSTIANTETDASEEVIDVITIPENSVIIFTSGVASNLSISRADDGKEEGTSLREFDGQPTGTIFVTPMEVNFVPAKVEIAKGETPEIALATLYYNETTQKWEAEENYATYKNGAFVGEIHHFSKFKFGFKDSENKSSAETPIDTITIDKVCSTGDEAVNTTLKITYKGGIKYKDGASIAAIIKKAYPTLTATTLNMVSNALTGAIKADNANVTPTADFTDQTYTGAITIDANTQLKGFEVVKNAIETTYTLPFAVKGANGSIEKKTASVTVIKVVNIVATPIKAMGHGHGHGDNINAGGGIVISE